jgi:methionyl-tRNA formyltransferase
MRLVCFVNNWTGWQVLDYLQDQEDEIVGLVLHPAAKRTYGDEILGTCDPGPDAVFDGSTLRDPEVVEAIADLEPDLGVSVLFDYILRRPMLDLFPEGMINLHPAYLPYNRGQYPNVWSIVEGTPAGTTLHYIDEGIDTGDVIAQRRVEVDPDDTGETLYRKLERASVDLFRDTWPLIRAGEPPRFPQPEGGTSHRTADVERIDAIDPDRTYTARELIDILRARTFPPYDGAYLQMDDRRIYLRVELTERASPAG